MAVQHAKRSAAVGGFIIVSVLACTDRAHTSLPSAPPALLPHTVLVTPIYDENGEPNITSYSSNTQVTVTDAVAGYDGSDAAAERSYFEEYTWSDPSAQWDIDLSFSNGDLPFGSTYPPEVDVARAQMMFGVTGVDVRNRSGSLLSVSSTRPTLVSDGHSTRAVSLPSASPSARVVATGSGGGIPNDHPVALASHLSPAASVDEKEAVNRDSIGRARRAAVVERLVITPQGRARLLAKLQSQFHELPGTGGARLFSQRRGTNEVRIIFDSAIGAISRMETRNGDRLVSRTVNRYATVQGVTVLSEVTTTLFDADGVPLRTFTERHTNITMR